MDLLYYLLPDEQLVALFLYQFSKGVSRENTSPMPEWLNKIRESIPALSFFKLAKVGRAGALYKIGMELVNISRQDPTEGWLARQYLGGLEFMLGLTPNPELVEVLIRLSVAKSEAVKEATESGPWSRSTPAGVNSFNASLLACGQSSMVLFDAMERHLDDEDYLEVLSFLLQELIIRGARGTDSSVLRRLHARMQERKLPLAWLPLELSAIETDIVLHKFDIHADGAYGGGKGEIFLNQIKDYFQDEGAEQKKDTTAYIFTEITTENERAKIRAAVSDWEEDSNGVAESRVFAIQPPFVPGVVCVQHLLSLQLECLQDTETSQIWLREISPVGAFECLYRAAAFGGAYSWGHKGARGRLETWYSLAGLVGAPKEASFEDVLERVRRSRWFFFLGSQWFQGIWELGLVALRPERDILAVLAATDTD